MAIVSPYQADTSTMVLFLTAIPATCRSVTVRSLSVNAYVGTPPMSRKVVSSPAMTEGIVRSRNARMTRKRDHASHAMNSTVFAPSITGPSP